MNILHIGKYFPPYTGGMETYLKDLMIAQHESGTDTQALVHQSTISLRSSEEQFRSGEATVTITRAALWLRMLFTPISPTFPLLLRRIIARKRPDILHLHLPNVSAFWCLLLPSARRIPWVIHWHADVVASEHSVALRMFYTFYRPFEQALLRHSQRIIVTSPPYLQSSEPLQKFRDKCTVVPLGIGDEHYRDVQSQDRETAPGGRSLRVLATGRLSYYKGFEYLIRAAAQVPEADVHLVGGGDLEKQLKSLAAELGISDRIQFHGRLPDSELVQQYALCDCLCLPSIERTEAFGMVLLEAMCCGRAVIASDVPGSGMGWVVDHQITGLKVPPEDVEALAAALRQLADSRDKITALGNSGQQKFYRQFHISRSSAGVDSVYREALAEVAQQKNR